MTDFYDAVVVLKDAFARIDKAVEILEQMGVRTISVTRSSDKREVFIGNGINDVAKVSGNPITDLYGNKSFGQVDVAGIAFVQQTIKKPQEMQFE